jgi:hypothetical protein
MLYTMLVMFAPALIAPNLSPIYSDHTTAHLSYETCQIMAQNERAQARGDGFFIPAIRCVPDDQVDQNIAQIKAIYQHVAGSPDSPPLYTLRGNLTVDGRPVPQITSAHLTWDQCQDQIAQGQAIVAAQHGRGTLSATCEKE